MTQSDWTSLSSTNLDAFRYDPDTLELDVRFKSGNTYRYSGVPAYLVDQLDHADSPGKFFAAEIKGAYFAGRI